MAKVRTGPRGVSGTCDRDHLVVTSQPLQLLRPFAGLNACQAATVSDDDRNTKRAETDLKKSVTEGMERMRLLILLFLVLPASTNLWGHGPYLSLPPTHPRFDPIPPLGNRLPPSYRRVYNRPTYVGGKLAHVLAPTSQEAMSWHEHVHRGSYRNHAGRIEPLYFYPKPWEVLTVGPRPAPQASVE